MNSPGLILWCFWNILSIQRPEKMGYKNNIVIDFNQSTEAIALNSTHKEIHQPRLQVNDLVHKSHTITNEHDELVNIAIQVKNNISLRKMEFSTIKRISEQKFNR